MIIANEDSLAFTYQTLKILKLIAYYYYKEYYNTRLSHKIVPKEPRVNLLSKERKYAIC